MKKLPYLIAASTTALLYLSVQAAGAQTFTNEWRISAHTGYTSIDATTRHTTSVESNWWGRHDDSNMNYGVSASYFPWRNLGVRATYERGSGYQTTNECPPDTVCTAILITESGNMEHYALALAPEFDIYRNTVAFITLGAARTEVSAGPVLPSYSETDIIYGAGIGFQLSPDIFLTGEYQTTNSDYETFRLSVGFRF